MSHSHSHSHHRTVRLRSSLARGGWGEIDSVQLAEIIREFSFRPDRAVTNLIRSIRQKDPKLESYKTMDSLCMALSTGGKKEQQLEATPTPSHITSISALSSPTAHEPQDGGGTEQENAEVVARFLYEHRSRLDPVSIGFYLGKKANGQLRKAWVEQVEFITENIEMSFRRFLRSFNLPGEGQMIDRYCESFSEVYAPFAEKDFSESEKKKEDLIYGFVTLLLMANTTLHNENSLDKMTLIQFTELSSEFSVFPDLAEHCYNQITDLAFEFFSPLPLPLLQGTFHQNSSSTVWVELSRKCLTIRRGYGMDYTKRITLKQMCVDYNGKQSLTFIFLERNIATSTSLSSVDGSNKYDRITLTARCTYTARLWYRTCTENGVEKSISSFSHSTSAPNSDQNRKESSESYSTSSNRSSIKFNHTPKNSSSSK
jgi:hypothetical protein